LFHRTHANSGVGSIYKLKIMKIFHIFILLFVSVLLSSCGVFTDITYHNAKKKAPYDAIIVPGFPYEKGDDLSVVYKIRIFWAYHLFNEGIAKNIIFSGSAVHTPYVEAKIMAEYAKQMGIPEANIFIEDSAEHSTENLFYSYQLAKHYGFEKVAVATDPFQSGMISYLTSKDKLPVDYIPAKVETIASKYWDTFDFNINEKVAYKEDFIPLAERTTKEERMRGTQGQLYRERKEVVVIN
jgi:uncharacterized SAM-binding protein YcdF (DUF218 family)